MDNIKYYPDRFYIRLDDFDINNLASFITNLNLGQQHAIFIHEYYHYLTNVTTYAGIRQFNVNFCDRFRLVTNLTVLAGLDAFPLQENTRSDCQKLIHYWNSVLSILNEDDIDMNLVRDVENSINRKLDITRIYKEIKPETFWIQGHDVNGVRSRIKVEVGGLINRNSFQLTYGALDEFLSSSIDEFLFEKDIAEVNTRLLNDRPYYPYRFFEDLLRFYGIDRPTSFEKILIAYYSLNSHNPPVALVELLEDMRDGGYEAFQQDTETYLLKRRQEPDMPGMVAYTRSFSEQCVEQGRVHIGQALRYYGDRFYIAHQFKQEDFFYFVRPFFTLENENARYKQQFLLGLARIVQVFTPPIILKDGAFFYEDMLTTMGEATTHIIALYEIFESVKTLRIARRPDYLKERYNFPEKDPDCDDITKFTDPPIYGSYRLALNEVGLYRLYLKEGRKA